MRKCFQKVATLARPREAINPCRWYGPYIAQQTSKEARLWGHIVLRMVFCSPCTEVESRPEPSIGLGAF